MLETVLGRVEGFSRFEEDRVEQLAHDCDDDLLGFLAALLQLVAE